MKILLVVDYSARSNREIARFAGHPWPAGTIVRVLAIVENIPPSAAELWFDEGGSLELVFSSRIEKAEQLVAEAAGRLQQNGLVTETVVRRGRRRKTIAHEVQIWSADALLEAAQGVAAIKLTAHH